MSRVAHRHMRQLAEGRDIAYDKAILADGPIAYWTLDGGTSGITDRTGNSHNGSYYNSPGVTDFLNGTLATVFNGSSQYIEVPNSTALSVTGSGILTIEAWMRPDTLEFTSSEGSGYVYWMGKGEVNEYEYATRMYSLTNTESRPNRISGYAYNLSGGLGTGSYFQDAVTAGEWIHYVLIINTVNVDSQYTTGYTKIYKNGEQRDKDALTTYSTVPEHGDAPFRLGTRDFYSYFQGAIGKVAVYDYEISATTVRDHYQTIVSPVDGSAKLIKHVGAASTKTTGTTLSLTVGDNLVSAGSTLIVKVAHEYTAGGPTVIDSKGNTYTRDQTSPNGSSTMRASLFSAPINSALQPGDTILLTTSASVGAKAISVDEFSGIVFTSNIDQKNSTSGTSTTPGTTIPITTTQADELVCGFVAVNGPTDETYTEDDLYQWTGLTRAGTTGDAATSNVTVNSAYKSVGTTSTYRYQPTLGTSESWIEIIASYKAGQPVITPPVLGTAIFIQNIGTNSTKTAGTTLTLTVPANGTPIGHTLIARVLHDYTAGGPTMTDSRGNTYTRDRTAAYSTNIRMSVFSCRVTTALQSGDTITLTTSVSVAAKVLAVDEFANVLLPIAIDVQNGATGSSTAPALSATTTNANDLLIGMVGTESPSTDSYIDDAMHQWTGLTRIGTSGDVSNTNVTVNGVYRAAGSTGTYSYTPTLGASANWTIFIMAYKAS